MKTEQAMPTSENRHLVFSILLGATPLLMALAPMAFTPDLAGWQVFLRAHAFIVLAIELAVIFLLMRGGGSVLHGWNMLPSLSRWAIFALALISISVSFQPDKDHLAGAIGLSRAAFAGLFALALLGSDGFGDRHWRSLWIALAIGAFAYFGLFSVYVTVNNLNDAQWIMQFPGFNNIRHVAFLGLVAFGGGLACLLLADRKPGASRRAIMMLPIGVAAMALVLWTGSRGPLLAISFAAICCLILFSESRRAILIYAMLCFGLGIAIASILPIPNPIYGILQAFGIADVSAENLNRASSGRIEVWLYTIEEAMKRPFFGWGVNQYAHFLPDGRERLFHPHNYPVQLLFASGFVGAFLVIAAAGTLVWQRRGFIQGRAQKFNAIIAATLLLYSLYDGILYFSYPMMIFVLVFIGCLQPQRAPA